MLPDLHREKFKTENYQFLHSLCVLHRKKIYDVRAPQMRIMTTEDYYVEELFFHV